MHHLAVALRRAAEVKEMYAHLPVAAPAKACDSLCCLEEAALLSVHQLRAAAVVVNGSTKRNITYL